MELKIRLLVEKEKMVSEITFLNKASFTLYCPTETRCPTSQISLSTALSKRISQ